VPIIRSPTGQRVAGLIVVVVGVVLILQGKRMGSPALYADRRPFLSRVRPGRATAYPLGMAFAAGWTPCVGPVLAATLALATVQGDAARGGLLLLAYSLGLGVPFVLLGLGVGRLMGTLDVLKRHHEMISMVSGVIMVSIGLLLMSGLWAQVMAPIFRLVNRFQPAI
jgi:cytochrome c-type biogenesis protein